MNYVGLVSSVNTTLWTFELDNKLTVHMGHMATHNVKQMLPEIGEQVQLFNAHYKPSQSYHLQKLFLCEKSRIVCNCYKKDTRETELLEIINEYSLGVSDLLEIDYNTATVNDFIKPLAQQSTEQIILEVLRRVTKYNKCSDGEAHRCLNKNIPAFSLVTISTCRYIDSHSHVATKGPPWSFGTHSKSNKSDILVGYIQINKRYGVVLFYDAKHQMPCLITVKTGLNKNHVLNKFVLVRHYRVFTESYREADAPNLEYVLFDVEDVVVLDLTPLNAASQHFLVEVLPEDFPYVYDFEFKLMRKALVNIFNQSSIECWLDVLVTKNSRSYSAYLALNAYQVQISPLLREGETYHVYHGEKLRDCRNVELFRVQPHSVSQKFTEKNAIFVHQERETPDCDGANENLILNVAETIEKMKQTNSCISFQGLLSVKKFTKSLSSRTQDKVDGNKCTVFGTPGDQTHTLIFVDDTRKHSVLLYLNNWENLQIPLGLVLDMRICVKNVLPQKKYLKSCAMTAFEVLGYEPPVFFSTVNLNTDQAHGCDKYSFVGLGGLLPCNVLIWARILQLYVRSLKIIYKCETCGVKLCSTEICACGNKRGVLDATITFFVHDEMGQALIISKSLELLRLLLGLEPLQWKIWCSAFESVGEYVHEFETPPIFSQDSAVNAFCEVLATSIKVINAMKISDLELQCRKMDSSTDDNEGMPVWFCVDARKTEEATM